MIALAGDMRLLSDYFVARWRGRLINIHPSLLPKYKGLDTHARAIAAASLANSGGGLLVVGVSANPAGTVTSVGGVDLAETDLLAAGDDLGPNGRYLIGARTVDAGGKRVGLLAVAESAAPPVLVETSGAIYCRSDAGLVQVRTRLELDQLLEKERALRQRAERHVEGMLDRLAFGHFNYMTVAVVASSRVLTDLPYRWASEHQADLLALDFAKTCGFSASDVEVRAGEIELSLSDDVTGIVRVARNGCVAVGERRKRPAQDLFLAPADLSRRLNDMALAAAALFQTAHAGPILGALFLEGVRDLRLPVAGGTTAPAGKDLVRHFLPERCLEGAGERGAFCEDVLRAAGDIFGADLVNGEAQPEASPTQVTNPQPQIWHGLTKRTERRIAGLRGHGST